MSRRSSAALAIAEPEIHQSPILFSGPMVRAILAGQKTQTRRALRERFRIDLRRQITSDLPGMMPAPRDAAAGRRWAGMNPHGAVWTETKDGPLGVKPGEFDFVCPYAVGETRLVSHGTWNEWTIAPRDSVLWVRETFSFSQPTDPKATGCAVAYQATRELPHDWPAMRVIPGHAPAKWGQLVHGTHSWNDEATWRPSIFMPRWASRLTLAVTDVRIQHLQSISDADIAAEGVTRQSVAEFFPDGVTRAALQKIGCLDAPIYAADWTPRDCWRIGWSFINGAASWAANPMVWANTFRRLP